MVISNTKDKYKTLMEKEVMNFKILKTKKKASFFLLLTLSTLLLPSCSRDIASNVYTENMINETYSTKMATVIDRRAVKVQETDKLKHNETGGFLGGFGGAVAGGQGSKGWGSAVSGVAGAAIGAAVGGLAEKKLNTQDAFEYVIQIDGEKDLQTIVQGGESIEVGQAVYLIEPKSGGRARIRPRNV